LKLGVEALKTVEGSDVGANALEVAVLDRTRGRRKFRRLEEAELAKLL
jgi:hypothetical protein